MMKTVTLVQHMPERRKKRRKLWCWICENTERFGTNEKWNRLKSKPLHLFVASGEVFLADGIILPVIYGSDAGNTEKD
jgi:hypothetical protein